MCPGGPLAAPLRASVSTSAGVRLRERRPVRRAGPSLLQGPLAALGPAASASLRPGPSCVVSSADLITARRSFVSGTHCFPVSSLKAGVFVFCSLLYPQPLAHSRHFMNRCWLGTDL